MRILCVQLKGKYPTPAWVFYYAIAALGSIGGCAWKSDIARDKHSETTNNKGRNQTTDRTRATVKNVECFHPPEDVKPTALDQSRRVKLMNELNKLDFNAGIPH